MSLILSRKFCQSYKKKSWYFSTSYVDSTEMSSVLTMPGLKYLHLVDNGEPLASFEDLIPPKCRNYPNVRGLFSEISRGHFVFLHLSSPALNFSSPLLAAVACMVVFPVHLSGLLRCARSHAPRSASFLPFTFRRNGSTTVTKRFSSIAFQTFLTAPMRTRCSNMTAAWDTARASEQMRKSTRICFFLSLLN